METTLTGYPIHNGFSPPSRTCCCSNAMFLLKIYDRSKSSLVGARAVQIRSRRGLLRQSHSRWLVFVRVPPGIVHQTKLLIHWSGTLTPPKFPLLYSLSLSALLSHANITLRGTINEFHFPSQPFPINFFFPNPSTKANTNKFFFSILRQKVVLLLIFCKVVCLFAEKSFSRGGVSQCFSSKIKMQGGN